jgi:dCMP deaminase
MSVLDYNSLYPSSTISHNLSREMADDAGDAVIRAGKARQYYEFACDTARRFSKDPSSKVAAVLLRPGSLSVLSLGYNGMPRGIDEGVAARWQRPAKYMMVEHAERNALYNACRHGTPIEGAICVVTMFPCADCARALIQSGVRCVVSPPPDPDAAERWGEHHDVARAMFDEAGVQVIDPSFSGRFASAKP